MWFSSNRPKDPDRRIMHATVVAYVALVFAVLGASATAAAATLIRTRDIADGAVTNPKIANNAVGNLKLRNDSVGELKLRNNGVTAAKLRNNAVVTRTVEDGAVTHPKLADGAVGTRNLEDGSVTHPKLADGAVGNHNIKNGTITGDKIANNTITGANIAEGTLHDTKVIRTITGGPAEVTATDAPGQPYPLSPAGPFQQQVPSIDHYVGHFVVSFPAGCGVGSVQIAVLLVSVNGTAIGGGAIAQPGSATATTLTVAIPLLSDPAPSTQPQSKTVTADVFGSCVGEATLHPTIDSAQIIVQRTQ